MKSSDLDMDEETFVVIATSGVGGKSSVWTYSDAHRK